MSEQKDFTKGSILKHIWVFSLPTIAAFALQTSYNLIDTIFVGRLGADAIAGVSLAFPVMILMIAIGSGVGIGTSSLIARYLGSKNLREAGKVAEHAILISLLFSVIFGLAGWFFAKPLFTLIGATGPVLSLAMDYSVWIFGFGGFMFVFIALSNILRGEGDAKTPMKCMIVSALLNVVLDPLFIFGLWFFPRLGVEGAAIATVISKCVGCVLLILHVLKGKSLIRISFDKFRYSFGIVKGIFSVGIPASMSHMLMSVGLIFITRIVASFGPLAIAAYGLGYKLESVAFYFTLGISISVVTLVGHNYGAGNVKRAKKFAWTASWLSMVVTGFIGLVFFFTPKFWLRVFTNDLSVISLGVPMIKIMSLVFMFSSLSMIIEGAFQGFGKGLPKFLLTLLRLGVLAVPLAYVLSKSFGLVGVWYGIAISYFINGVVAAVWFKMSKFEKSKSL